MIIRNAYTGTLQEVPDHQLYEVGEPVYDGFGNPVGSIFDDIAKGVGSLVSAPVQAATSLINPIAQMAGGILNPITRMAANIPGMISSAAGNFMNPVAGAASNFANTISPYLQPRMPMTSMPAPYGYGYGYGYALPALHASALALRLDSPEPAVHGTGPAKNVYALRGVAWSGRAGSQPRNAASSRDSRSSGLSDFRRRTQTRTPAPPLKESDHALEQPPAV